MQLQQKKTSVTVFYGKDDKLKRDNVTVEKEGNIEHGNDYNKCKIISS